MKDFYLGQYYPTDSVLHRADPRTVIVVTVLFCLELFVFSDYSMLAVAGVLLLAEIFISRIPLFYVLKGIRFVYVLVILTLVLNLVSGGNGDVLWQWGIMKITETSVKKAVVMSVRLLFIIIATCMVMWMCTMEDMTQGLETLLAPLEKCHIPVHMFAMIVTITLRFIPIFIEELERIRQAQMVRGFDFSQKRFMDRAKAMVPLIVPLFMSALSKAENLAVAMESRCYDKKSRRTCMYPLQFHKRDVVIFIVFAIYTGWQIWLKLYR